MGLPQVVIVGRPNVGKSSLFNWLVTKRIAIVDNTAGVTRDRLSYLMEHQERFFELVDTGGIGITDSDDLNDEIEHQIQFAVDSADLILFTVDTREGVTPLDQEVARRLRYVDVPVLCVANKTDDDTFDTQADEFYKLGRGKLIRVSTLQNRGRGALLDLIHERLPEQGDDEEGDTSDPEMKVALVGRRNVGKSTFINSLTESDRVIVSEVPGTTRDSIDVRFELDGKRFLAIDTPGLRKGKSVKTDIEFYGTHRAQRSIRRADVVLMFFDATSRISKVDKQLCEYISDNYKPCIFVINKWDLLAKSMPTEKWVTYVRDNFRTMAYVPIAFITGQTGKNIKTMLNHAQMLFKQSRQRESTGRLNKLVRAAIDHNPPPMHKNRRPKVYYATQVGNEPPTIVLFCNNPAAFSPTYRRYLLNIFRDNLPFGEIPIKLYLRKRVSSELDSADDKVDLSAPDKQQVTLGEPAEEEAGLASVAVEEIVEEVVLNDEATAELTHENAPIEDDDESLPMP